MRMQVVGAVGFSHQRLPLPDDLQPEVRQLILSCWEEEPGKRPSFGDVLEALGRLPNLSPSLTRLGAVAAAAEAAKS
jgi:hypothetical protein